MAQLIGESSEQSEVARLTSEAAILTRIIEHQHEELSRISKKNTELISYVLKILRDLLSSAVTEINNSNFESPAAADVVVASILARANLLDEDWYLRTNPDVSSAGLTALYHYSKHGVHEYRPPNEALR